MKALLFFLFLSCFARSAFAFYDLTDEYSGESFFSGFDFFTGADPTEGFVKYLGEEEARQAGLIDVVSRSFANDVVYMGVDHTNNVTKGRPSVRISSKKVYNQGLIIADFEHVPSTTCGSWPAFWMLGPNWPNGGEIDIYEGVNLNTENSMTLHTGPGCKVTKHVFQTGDMQTNDCDVNAPDQTPNQGCQVLARNPASYGTGFNVIGGGVFATQWTTSFIKMWFFPRLLSIPLDILAGEPSPAFWGPPAAYFTGDCDFSKSFVDQSIIFDTTFCGQWAGKAWNDSVCAATASTCEEFVANNPRAFEGSYWGVNYVRVYEDSSSFKN